MTARAELGACELCGQDLIRTADDCWHPHWVKRACPPEITVRFVVQPAFGEGFGRPGREHWQPLPCICGRTGLTYDGPDPECPTHGRKGVAP